MRCIGARLNGRRALQSRHIFTARHRSKYCAELPSWGRSRLCHAVFYDEDGAPGGAAWQGREDFQRGRPDDDDCTASVLAGG